jgi:hypothetical protein
MHVINEERELADTAPVMQTPALQKARQQHPLLFSLMTPVDAQETPQAKETASALKSRRLSDKNPRCLELQLDQEEARRQECEEELQNVRDELEEERMQRVALEEMLHARECGSRESERRQLEWQRVMATEARLREQQTLEDQRWMQAEREAAKEQSDRYLQERMAALEKERICFDMERHHLDEDRRRFLLHRVQEADAELLRRERESKNIHRARISELEAREQQVKADAAALEEAKRQLAVSQKQHKDRVAALERSRALLVDRASQTPNFRHRGPNGTRLPYKLIALPLAVVVLVCTATWRPELWQRAQSSWQVLLAPAELQDEGMASSIHAIFRKLGGIQQCPRVSCPPCPSPQMQHPYSGLNVSGHDLASLCSTVQVSPSLASSPSADSPWKMPLQAVGAAVPLMCWLVTP